MRHIRGLEAFNLISWDDIWPIPRDRAGSISVSLAEVSILIAIARVFKMTRIFEFGTYLGETTWSIAKNTKPETEIWTLDLDHAAAETVKARPESLDSDYVDYHLAGRLVYEGTPYESRIHQLIGDSRTFDFRPYFNTMDLVLIDGGHDFHTMVSDTDNALLMAKPGGVIAWHDYGSPDYPHLTKWLDDFRGVVHVDNTMMALLFR